MISGGTDPSGWRLPATKLEHQIATSIASHIVGLTETHRLLATPDLRRHDLLLDTARTLAKRLRDCTSGLLHKIVKIGHLSQTSLHLDLAPNILAAELEVASEELAIEAATFTVPVALRRRGVETKLVIGSSTKAPDPVLIRALADAHRWALALREGTPLKTVAQEAGHHGAYIRTRGQLAFLSPKIQRAIRDGTQPVDLTLERLMKTPVPLDWREQDRLYGM